MALTMFASFRGYVLGSFLLTIAVISHAVYMKRFFYRSVIFLAKSKFAILAVGNMGLVSVLVLWRLIQAIFLGPLRFREVERLHIRARDAVIECCFAISVFRDEFDVKFVALVLTLLLLKSLHWLSKDRIEFLEEQPLSPLRTHLRLVGLMTMLLVFDIFLVRRFATLTIHMQGPTMFILFVFEFTVLIIELVSDIVRYIFLVIDNSMEGHWEDKGMFSFYIELLSDLCQLTVYIFFFVYVQFYYSFPYHIIRELYMTFHKFQKRCTDFLRYRRVVATMNDLFADAAEEELAEGDRTCIICREEMQAAKKLACGHIFHARCLQSWLKRQLSCPTCRATIDVNNANTSQATPNNPQMPNRGNNINNANYNNNPNNPAPQPNNQRPANIGEAGARFLNFANHWWNQIMNEAGGAGLPRMARADGPRRPAQLPGVRPGAPGAPGGTDVGVRPGAAEAAREAGDVGAEANIPQANQRLQPLQPNMPYMPNFGPDGNMFLRGPNANALAHMQLRARRQGAWPHPYQQFQVPGQHVQPGQQNVLYNLNPYLPPQPLEQLRDGAQHGAQQSDEAASQNPVAGESMSGGNEDQRPQEAEGRAGSSGESSGGAAGSSSANNGIAEAERNGSGQTTGSRVQERSPSSTNSTVQPPVEEANGTVSRGILENQTLQEVGEPAARGEIRVDSIPLERLLAIQEQIEVLRSEVMDLVLLATSTPATPHVPENTLEERTIDESQQEASTAAMEQGTDDGDAVAAVPENREEQEESEAAVLRRRRMEFLAKNSRA